jgi:hypothetical protein
VPILIASLFPSPVSVPDEGGESHGKRKRKLQRAEKRAELFVEAGAPAFLPRSLSV